MNTSNTPDEDKSFFSSKRERHLWTGALAVIVAIYATLGLANTLAGILRDRNLIVAGFFLGMILVGTAVVAIALKIRPSGVEIGVALGVITAYLLVFLRMTMIEERSHIIEYSIVAALIYAALKERKSNGRRVPMPALLAIALTALVGTLDECIQLFLPNRVFDPEDIIFNTLAAVMAVTASVALAWARRLKGEIE